MASNPGIISHFTFIPLSLRCLPRESHHLISVANRMADHAISTLAVIYSRGPTIMQIYVRNKGFAVCFAASTGQNRRQRKSLMMLLCPLSSCQVWHQFERLLFATFTFGSGSKAMTEVDHDRHSDYTGNREGTTFMSSNGLYIDILNRIFAITSMTSANLSTITF
jgi:hypothetical protein